MDEARVLPPAERRRSSVRKSGKSSRGVVEISSEIEEIEPEPEPRKPRGTNDRFVDASKF
jgi:hypothetical protein